MMGMTGHHLCKRSGQEYRYAVIHADSLEGHQEAGKAGSLGEDGGQGWGGFH